MPQAATPTGRDELGFYYVNPNEQPPDTDHTHRCRICGDWFTTYRHLAVHGVKHQRRRCRFCGDPKSANSITMHEKHCKARHQEQLEGCEGWSILQLFAPTASWLDQACTFLQEAAEVPCDPGICLVMFADRKPTWVRTAAVGAIITQLGPQGVMAIPSNELKRVGLT